jgi:hypothetical protein
MARFVILEHDHPCLHWDLMLEVGQALRTWRLASPPVPGRAIPAKALGAHRLLYLDYEGPVSGNRGHVVRWDSGQCHWQADTADRVAVELAGARVRGVLVVSRLEGGEWSAHLS